jgi:arylsulfatase A-like enzyme
MTARGLRAVHRICGLSRRLGVAAVTLATVRAATPPNILYILADDLGYGDVSCLNPQSKWSTPQIDRVAREGVLFTDAHSASSLCTPARYALLTGRYAWRGQLKQGVLQGYSAPLIESDRPTVAGFLREHGYATAMFGKWHLGLDWAPATGGLAPVDFAKPVGGGPIAHGFERFFGISASLDMPPYVWIDQDRTTRVPTGAIADSPAPRLWRAGPIAPDFKLEDVQPRLTDMAIAYLNERGAARDGRPFFLYLALAAPHTPLLPTREFDGKTQATTYGDFVAQVDDDIGRILRTLEATGQARNTLVVITSDNGFAPAAGLTEHLKIGHDPSGGLRGYKSDLFDGGHRIPFIVRWPGVAAAGLQSPELVEQLDLFATCAEILGAKMPASAAEDSVSMLPLLRGRNHGAGAGGDRPSFGRRAVRHPPRSVEAPALARLRGLEPTDPDSQPMAQDGRGRPFAAATIPALRPLGRSRGADQPRRGASRNGAAPRPPPAQLCRAGAQHARFAAGQRPSDRVASARLDEGIRPLIFPMPRFAKIKWLLTFTLGLPILFIAALCTPLRSAILPRPKYSGAALPPSTVAVPHLRTIAWKSDSPLAVQLYESWAKRPLVGFQKGGKGDAARIILGRLLARHDLPATNAFILAAQPWASPAPPAGRTPRATTISPSRCSRRRCGSSVTTPPFSRPRPATTCCTC